LASGTSLSQEVADGSQPVQFIFNFVAHYGIIVLGIKLMYVFSGCTFLSVHPRMLLYVQQFPLPVHFWPCQMLI
jgi:hypothetical protein